MSFLNCRAIALSIIFSLPQIALAGSDIAPFNGAAGVEIVNTSGEAQVWYPLSPGQSLDYAFTGPGRLWLYVRSGASPRSGVWNFSTEAELSVLLSGRAIERIPQVPSLDGFGGLEDTESYPWIARGVLVDVPGGDSSIGIEAGLSGPPVLLRVVSTGQVEEAAPTVVEVEQVVPATIDFVEVEEVEQTGTILDLLVDQTEEVEEVGQTGTILDLLTEQTEEVAETEAEETVQAEAGSDLGEVGELEEEPEATVGTESTEPGDEATILSILDVAGISDEPVPPLDEEQELLTEDIPEAQSLGTLKERFITSLQAAQFGGSLGLGAPLRGDSPSPYIGAVARIELMPILWDGWNLDWGELYSQANIGWYRVGVNSDLVVNDVYAGQTELTVQYATSVIPMELSVGLEMPFAIGPVVPIAALGTGLYLSIRGGEDSSEFDASSGYSALLGGEMEILSGVAGVAFSHTGTSGSLGRLDESGNQANEKLSVERLDITYLTHF